MIDRRCDACGAPLAERQRWCLACGSATATRLAPTPRWAAIGAAAALLALVALAAAGYALAALAS